MRGVPVGSFLVGLTLGAAGAPVAIYATRPEPPKVEDTREYRHLAELLDSAERDARNERGVTAQLLMQNARQGVEADALRASLAKEQREHVATKARLNVWELFGVLMPKFADVRPEDLIPPQNVPTLPPVVTDP